MNQGVPTVVGSLTGRRPVNLSEVAVHSDSAAVSLDPLGHPAAPPPSFVVPRKPRRRGRSMPSVCVSASRAWLSQARCPSVCPCWVRRQQQGRHLRLPCAAPRHAAPRRVRRRCAAIVPGRHLRHYCHPTVDHRGAAFSRRAAGRRQRGIYAAIRLRFRRSTNATRSHGRGGAIVALRHFRRIPGRRGAQVRLTTPPTGQGDVR